MTQQNSSKQYKKLIPGGIRTKLTLFAGFKLYQRFVIPVRVNPKACTEFGLHRTFTAA